MDLKFQRKALDDIHKLVRAFAKGNDITYEIERELDSIKISKLEGNSKIYAHMSRIL